MNAALTELELRVAAASVLGYLNFSDGRVDPRWQRVVNEAWGVLLRAGSTAPQSDLFTWLDANLTRLVESGQAAFRDPTQAREILALVRRTLSAYRVEHRDLLAHLSDDDFFGPFFLVRVFEAALSSRARDDKPGTESVLARLNDYVGHRPVAILETRPQGEPYPGEKTRPVPLFLRDVGVAFGPYEAVVTKTLEILNSADPNILHEAQLSLPVMEELALDLRAYDHWHPANRRPNYVFGEWDPHHLDTRGRYARYVVRKITLDALMDRVRNPGSLSADDALFEGAAVLAGTILMGCGVSGMSPSALDSTVTLANLLPRIARYRDAFYENLLSRLRGPLSERIRHEITITRQPFGAARQALNAYLARHRALQMQHRYLSLLFAEMGYPEASAVEARRIPAASVRVQGNLLSQLTSGQYDLDAGKITSAAERLPRIEELLHRGIACGALADPWNILGFQGLYPLSPAREDSIRDNRVEELLQIVEQTFNLYARTMSEAAATDQPELLRSLDGRLKNLVEWWDRFATTTVNDLRRVHGAEALSSARHVSKALKKWRSRGEGAADLAFWREQLSGFRSPKSYALVVEALLRRNDFRAALALAISWLGDAEKVPLEDGVHSFHGLILRWLLALTRIGEGGEAIGDPGVPLGQRRELVMRLFGTLEANAEDYWEIPGLLNDVPSEDAPIEDEDDDEADLYGAAYDNVTYQDTTDDSEGAVSDGSAEQRPYDLEGDSDRLERRLRFLSTVFRLWQIAARFLSGARTDEEPDAETARHLLPALADWLGDARRKQARLLALLDGIHAHPLPEPSGDYDSLLEYDRHRVLKEQLVYTTIGTALDASLAVSALHGAGIVVAARAEIVTDTDGEYRNSPPWETLAIRLERDLFRGDADAVRETLPRFLVQFREEPLLFSPLTEGGSPRQILRVRIAQTILRGLLANLPRVGLLRETYELLRTARAMEQQRPLRGRGVTEFNHFFQTGYQAVAESLVDSSRTWAEEDRSDAGVVRLLEQISTPFLSLWVDHSRSLQLSILEGVSGEPEWRALKTFIQRFGSELFHIRFMNLGNLRGILHRGVGVHLDYLRENADPLKPMALLDALESGTVRREEVIRRLEVILQAVIENYEEYKDYNATTTQSDYGENLWVFLDFLRLKVGYDRNAWQFKPMIMAHEVLSRRGLPEAARLWERSLMQYTQNLATQHLDALALLERERSVRLSTIRDRLGERFLKPLALDRLCARVEPAMQAARTGQGTAEELVRLEEELQVHTANPVGVGLDVPHWLRRLEGEVHRVQAAHTTTATLAENFFRVPRRPLSLEALLRQIQEWQIPALPE